jgi:hypothetical protein
MASKKKPSIYSDRSSIGSVDELDEYGVWVKSEPQILSADNTPVELEDSLSADDSLTVDETPSGIEFPSEDTDEFSFDDAVLDTNETETAETSGISESSKFADMEFPDDDIELPSEEPISTDELEDFNIYDNDDKSAASEDAGPDIEDTTFDDFEAPASEETSIGDDIPVDIDDFDLPVDDETAPDASETAETESKDDFNLDDDDFALPTVKSIEQNIDSAQSDFDTVVEKKEGELSTHLLKKIADELSSIRTELHDLKKEFASVNISKGTDEDEKIALTGDELDNIISTTDDTAAEEVAEVTDGDKHGFFAGDDDDAIALTGDELDNIISTSEIAEEPSAEENAQEAGDEEDETIALTGDELDNIMNSADFTEESGTNETPESDFSLDDISTEETAAEETATDEISLDETPAEETSSEELSLDDFALEETPAEETPAAEASTDELSLDEASTEETSTETSDETSEALPDIDMSDDDLTLDLDSDLSDLGDIDITDDFKEETEETSAADLDLDTDLSAADINIAEKPTAEEEEPVVEEPVAVEEEPVVEEAAAEEEPVVEEAPAEEAAPQDEYIDIDTDDLDIDLSPETLLKDDTESSAASFMSEDLTVDEEPAEEETKSEDLSMDELSTEDFDIESMDNVLEEEETGAPHEEESPLESGEELSLSSDDLHINSEALDLVSEELIPEGAPAEDPLVEDLNAALENDSEELKQLREEGALPITPPPENASYLEDEHSLDLTDAVIDEPELSTDHINDNLEEPTLDESEFNLDALDDLTIEEEPAKAVKEEGMDLDDLDIDIPPEEFKPAEKMPEEQIVPEQVIPESLEAEIEEEPVPFEDDELDAAESIGEAVEEDKAVVEDVDGIDEIEELVEEPEPAPAATPAAAAPAPAAAPQISVQADLVPPSAQQSGAAGGPGFSIPNQLKSELRNILSYMDQLLESLPEEKIEEFAKSEYFDSYKKLFKELGLV